MSKLLLSIAFAAAPFAAFADILVDQAQTDTDGYYSDAYSANGAYYGTTVGDDFTLSSGALIQQIQFTGSSDAYNALDNADFSSFEVTVFDENFNVLQDLTASVASFTPTATGLTNSNGGLEYVYTLNTNFNLAAGSYRLAVGANVTDPANGSYWVWSLGGENPGLNYDNSFDGDGWNTYTTAPDQAFRISGQPVPEPASMAALGLGAVALLRRRRK